MAEEPKLFTAGFLRAIQRDSERSPLIWLEKHARFPHSARSKEYVQGLSPWVDAIIEAFFDPETERVCVRAPTGGGKTTLIESIVLHIVGIAPGPTLIIGQNDAMVQEWGETRLIKSLESTEPTREMLPESKTKRRKTSILFPHMDMFLGGANMSSLQEKSMQYLIGDEVWRWKQGMIGQLKARHHDRWNGKLLLVSQGWDGGHELDESFDNGSCEMWGFTCPECDEWQEWDWEQMRYELIKDEDGEIDMASTRETVRYVCRCCNHEWEDTAGDRRKLAMRGGYQAANSRAYRGWRSFTFPAWGVWWISWAEIVQEWILANKAKEMGDLEPLKNWTQKRAARTWKENLLDSSTELLQSDYSLREYENGEKIDGERIRVAWVDVQLDHFWMQIRAIRADGSSRLIYYSRVETWDLLRQIEEHYQVKRVLIDNQYGQRREEVYSKCIEYGWIAMHGSKRDYFVHEVKKGTKKIKVRKFYSQIQHYHRPGQGRCKYVYWASDPVKDVLAALLRRTDGYWGIPSDAPKSYLKQITGEVKRHVMDKETGRMKTRWVKIHENHAWDTEAMAVAFCLMTGLIKDVGSHEELTEEENVA